MWFGVVCGVLGGLGCFHGPGFMKCLSVFHQSLGLISLFLSFAASLSISSCFDLRISAIVFFLSVCNFQSQQGI